MPHVHGLKAEDFNVDEWRAIETHPRDASIFEVRERVGGPIARATWNQKHARIELEPGSNDVDKTRLTEWRMMLP